MARAGQVLATEGLIHVAGQVDGLAYIERGLVHPKGFALPVHIVQIVATGQQQPDNDHSDEPEFRTFLFADIRGYSAFVFQHSAAAAADLQTRYTQLVEERVRAHGGRVLEIAGDGAFVVFVTPRQAVQSAIDLQEEFVRIFVQERQLPVTLSIGVEAGEAIPMMGKYVGPPINLAGVICQRTEPGEVLLGETLSHLVRKMEGLVLVDRGAIDVPGYPEPVRLTRLMRDSRSVPDSSAP
jgi:class 3 adenylate cyclase